MSSRLDAEERVVGLAAFLCRQQLALPKNRSKAGWDHMDPDELLSLAFTEMAETSAAIVEAQSEDRVLAEIGDTIAFLGMIADVITARRDVRSRSLREVQEIADHILRTNPQALTGGSLSDVVVSLLEESRVRS